MIKTGFTSTSFRRNCVKPVKDRNKHLVYEHRTPWRCYTSCKPPQPPKNTLSFSVSCRNMYLCAAIGVAAASLPLY